MDSNDKMLQTVQDTIDIRKLLAPGESLVLGVSGGADSVALLHVLHRLGYNIVVAHLNHGVRGEASDSDESFVRALAASLGVKCETRKCDAMAEANAAGLSFEAHARALRYSFFASVAAANNISKIATAHHSDDQAETVLMRILRGTGTEGLAGIHYLRHWRGLSIVRPMLDCRHESAVAWLKENNLSWREDESNRDVKYRRNQVRHELLPLLEQKYNPQVKEALLRLADAQSCDNAYWEGQLGDLFKGNENEINRSAFRSWPEAKQRRIIMRLAKDREIEVSHERLLVMCEFVCRANTGAFCDMSGAWQLYSGAERVLLCQQQHSLISAEVVELGIPGDCSFLAKVFTARILDKPPTQNLKSYCNPMRQIFDAEIVYSPLLIRRRLGADVLRPFGMEGHKKLSDVLVDRKIPAPLRDAIPLLLSGNEIIWVVGVALSQYAAVTAETKRFLQVEVHDAPE